MTAPVPAPTAAASAASPAPASEPVMPGGRMVMSEVALSLRAASPAKAAEAATAVAARAGGYVSSCDSTTADDVVVRVEMVLRVPAEKLEPTLAELRRQGHVLDESVSGKDVTEEYSDARAEISAKRKLEERLLAIVASAKSVKEMLEVEGELTRVRAEIEKLEGRTRYLENRAAFATIRLSLASPSQPAAPVAE
ncbi:MAG TPA: DUF4349 domain-containing protein, partial [Polyangiaceae bacterium]|nr:DUF4349 domain-containing protein [Polyangiaceae bacterium]